MLRRTTIAKLVPCLIAIAVFLLGVASDYLLVQASPNKLFAIADDLVVAVAVGVLVLLYDRRRQRYLTDRLKIIREMNHHVRNALQVISLAPLQQEDEEVRTMMHNAVLRIEWALREVLPGEMETEAGANSVRV